MNKLAIGTINCQGQTKLTLGKQLQIQNHIIQYKIDILFCQETYTDEDTFENCPSIKDNYNIISNNSQNVEK